MLDNGLEVSDTGGTPIGYDCPGAIFERFDDDWCSVAYFYLDAPASSLPELPLMMSGSAGIRAGWSGIKGHCIRNSYTFRAAGCDKTISSFWFLPPCNKE